MGKAKKRSLQLGIHDKFRYMTRETALNTVVSNIDKRSEVLDIITLFDFSAEEMLEAGASYEDVMAFGGIVK